MKIKILIIAFFLTLNHSEVIGADERVNCAPSNILSDSVIDLTLFISKAKGDQCFRLKKKKEVKEIVSNYEGTVFKKSPVTVGFRGLAHKSIEDKSVQYLTKDIVFKGINFNLSKIDEDKEICKCIGFDTKTIDDGNNDILKAYRENAFKVTSKNIEAETNLNLIYEENATAVWKEVEARRNSLMVSASIYFKGDTDITKYFTNDSKELDLASSAINNTKTGDLISKDKKLGSSLAKIHKKVFVPTHDQLLTDKMPGKDYCVTPREFMAFNQLPNSTIEEELKKDIKLQNWNFEELEKEFKGKSKGVIAPETAEELKVIKEKIIFLHRNPMIKLMLQSKNESKKQALMAILKDYTKGRKQESDRDNSIVAQNKNNMDFRNKIANYFTDSGNKEIIRSQADNEWKNDIAKVQEKLENNSLLSKPHYSSRTELVKDLGRLYPGNGGEKIDMCKNSHDFMDTACTEAFALYCAHLRSPRVGFFLPDQKQSEDFDEILSDERDLQSNFFDKKNESYEEFNKLACHSVVKDKNNRSITYIDFRNTECNTSIKNEKCRELFAQKYGNQVDEKSGDAAFGGASLSLFTRYFSDEPLVSIEASKAKEIQEFAPTERQRKKLSGRFQNFRKLMGYGDSYDSESTSGFASSSTVAPTVSSSFSESSSSGAMDSFSQSFEAPAANTSFFSAPSVERFEKIDDVPRERLQEYSAKLNKEIDEYKKDGATSAPSSDYIQSLIKQNETLEMLLKEKEISATRSNELLDALNTANQKLAKNEEDKETEIQKRVDAKLSSHKETNYVSDQPLNRGPASVRSTGGYQGASNTGGESSGFRPEESSSVAFRQEAARNRESLAREEAKLVKVRQEAAGTITIENLRGPASTGANAIAINITDEFYKQVRNNLAGLNLKQIEGSIPKDQIALLEKKGEITLILKNGENPPVEVKVTRIDGSLVQVAKSTAKVVRESSLESLKNTLNLQNL